MKNYFFVFSFLLSCSSFSQSRINKSKNELNGRSHSSRQNSNDRVRSNDSHTFFDMDDGTFWLEVIPKIAFFSFIGNYNYEQHLNSNLTDYPYYNGESGNYENSDWGKKDIRLDIEDNLLFSSSTLYGNHLKVKIRPSHYFYLQSDFHQLFEKNKFDTSTDRLSVFNFNLGYDRLRLENVNIGWTIGAAYIGNEVKKTGLSIGLSTELFLSNHISLSAAAKWSFINGYPVDSYDIQTRYHHKVFFASIGFEHLKIGTPNYNFIALGGGIYLN